MLGAWLSIVPGSYSSLNGYLVLGVLLASLDDSHHGAWPIALGCGVSPSHFFRHGENLNCAPPSISLKCKTENFLLLLPLHRIRSLMSNASTRGIVHLIEDTKTFGQKGFRKRLVVLEQNLGRFTNYIPFEFTNDACDSVDSLKLGDDITITYRLTGRKWQKDSASDVKYFLTAEAMGYRISGDAGQDNNAINDEFSEASSDMGDAPF